MKSGQFKLSDFEVQTIFESTAPPKAIAAHYEISVSMVSKIKCGIAYADITKGLVRGKYKARQLHIRFSKRILL